jgi:ABC-type glycerol-3-phosphate transport system substrate-binding protein
MLQQRGIDLVDGADRIHLADPKVAQTVAFYAQCVAGQSRIGAESGDGEGPLATDLREGNLCALFAADWRLPDLKRLGGDALRGDLRFMPLPRFDDADAPTATWGGTMIGILRSSPNKPQAWALIKQLYFDGPGVAARARETGIIPPIPELWNSPEYQQPNDYFGGQPVMQMLVALARQIPRTEITPATGLANVYLMQVLAKATRHAEQHGGAGLEAACQHWLDDAAADLGRRMKQWDFDR